MNCRSLKTAENLRINITKIVIKNVTHYFILNGKELPIHYSTIADVFRDVFCDFYLRSFMVLHFRGGHVVIEAPINQIVKKNSTGIQPPLSFVYLISIYV